MRNPPIRTAVISAAMAACLASTALASTPRAVSSGLLYVRARAAATAGDARAASDGFSQLLTRDPTSPLLAQRAYAQALSAGDLPLALRATRQLERQGAIRPDGQLLLAIEAIRTGNWADAQTTLNGVEKDKLFSFLVPMMRAWIALGTHQGDPLAIIEPVRAMPIAQPYFAEQRALLLIAMGKTEEGVSALRAASQNRPTSIRLRMIAAGALAGEKQGPRALDALQGDDPTLVAARARIEAGKRLPGQIDGAATGIAVLLVRVASDFGQQQLAPIGFTLARFATFLAPQDAAGWLMTANLLGSMQRLAPALDALSHIPSDDPLSPAALALRIALLSQLGNRDAALAEALKAVEAPGADVAAWSRLGDVYLAMSRPADGAKAYAKAIALAEANKQPSDLLWPLWLQQGAALDQAGDWAGSKAAMTKALALAPNQALVLNQLGYSQVSHRENVARASALIEQASKLRPDDPAITDSLGWVYYLRGDVAEAVPLLERASSGDPTEPAINEHLGDAYWKSGRLLEARYAWRAALVTAEDKDRARLNSKIDIGLSDATAAP